MTLLKITTNLRNFAIAALTVFAVVSTSLNQSGLAQSKSPPPKAPAAAVPAYRKANHIAVLTIKGGIDGVTLRSLERRIKKARNNGAEAIVLDLDTPGGEVVATLDICSLLKSRSETPVNTVAWIHPNAYSGGTIIALACREIIVASNASLGDAAPITGMPGIGLIPIPLTERAKMESPILAEVVDSARRNHYDENLVQSFISVGVELWLIRNDQTDEMIFVDREEYHTVFGEDPSDSLTPVAPPDSVIAANTGFVRPSYDSSIPRDESIEGSLLTPEQIKLEIERAQALEPSRTRLTQADRGQWSPVGQVISNDRLLTIKAAEARFYGLASAQINTDEQLKAYFGASTLIRYDRVWSEVLVRFLINFWVRVVLIIILLICIFVEMAMPGTGLFGAGALGALLLLVGAPYLAGMAQWWEILLIGTGFLLVALEIFVIPGFGVAGVIGALCILIGLVGTFVSGDLSSPEGQDELVTGLAATVGGIFAAGVGIWFISRQLQSIPMLNRVILKAELAQAGAPAAHGLLQAMGSSRSSALEPGVKGVAETDLRPSGRATIAGRLVDVTSVGGYIDRGAPVQVVSASGFVVEVEEVRA